MTQESERYPVPQPGWHMVDFGQFWVDPVPEYIRQRLQLSGKPAIIPPKVAWMLYASVTVVNSEGRYQRVFMN